MSAALSIYLIMGSGLRGTFAVAQTPSPSQTESPAAGDQPKVAHAMTFRVTQQGQLLDDEGAALAFTLYKAPSGIVLTMVHRRFESRLLAQAYFDKQIGKATKIIQRGDKKDKEGKVIGERAQGLFPVEHSDVPTPAVLWTNGADFYEILGSSVPTILKLESELTP